MIHLDCLGQFPLNIYVVSKLGLAFKKRRRRRRRRTVISIQLTASPSDFKSRAVSVQFNYFPSSLHGKAAATKAKSHVVLYKARIRYNLRMFS